MRYQVKAKEDGGGSESVRASNSFLNLIPCEWNKEFATRRDLDYSTENKPYIEWLARIGVEDNVETPAEPGEEENVVRDFMRRPYESDVCAPHADKVENFCSGANLKSLQSEEGNAIEALQRVALLDDRSFEGGIGRSRIRRGPLTAPDLYKQLKKPRFRVGRSNHSIGTRQVSKFSENLGKIRAKISRGLIYLASGSSDRSAPTATSTAGNSATPSPDEEEPDAEQRLIFVTDLDRWSIYALIGTVSYLQAFALRAAIYRHLAFETFIGVEFSSDGLLMFQLAFHLPYYVWRSSQEPCKDPRQFANGDPLRHSRDASFLNWKTCGSPGILYEAQISFVVAGSDEWRWIAYCFVDTYFDTGNEARETVLLYHDDSQADLGMSVDPFTRGQTDLDKPISNPREYFLTVVRFRIGQVKCEWQQVVEKMYQSFREYEETHPYLLSLSRKHSSSKEAEDHHRKIQDSLHWVIKFRGLSKHLLIHLSKTVSVWERFCYKDAVNFQNLSESADGHRSLPTIQTMFDELESLKERLESLAVPCDGFTRDLELHLGHEAIEVGNRQRELAQDNKGLSVMMMLFISPVALTAGIFSMNKDVIPFIPANFGSFICLILIFGVMGVVIHVIQPYRFWCWQVVMASTGQTVWDRKIRGPRFKMLRSCRDSVLGQPTSDVQQDVENEAGLTVPV